MSFLGGLQAFQIPVLWIGTVITGWQIDGLIGAILGAIPVLGQIGYFIRAWAVTGTPFTPIGLLFILVIVVAVLQWARILVPFWLEGAKG